MFFYELETKRLLLKNISYEDKDFIFKQFSTDSVNRYLYDAEPVKTIEEADEIIASFLDAKPRLQHRWILTLKSNGEKIGTCGYHCWDKYNNCVELGYDLQEAYWDQGLMREAIGRIIEFAREEMKVSKIHAHIYVENEKSIRLAERLLFAFQGETKMYLFHNKQYLHNIYSLDLSLPTILSNPTKP